MASLYELTVPIDQKTLEDLQKDLRKPLKNLQGNILQGHGREHAVHIFLKFREEGQEDGRRAKVKEWISGLAKHITSAQKQLDEIEQYRQHGIPGSVFMNFFLSAKGYIYLYPASQANPRFDNEAFLRGMEAAQHRLNDPPKEAWEEEYRQDIDAMLLLADDDEHFLLRQARLQLDNLKAHAKICVVELGRVMRNAQEDSIEHFGYTDGHSQPLFFQKDIDWKRRQGDKMNVWDPGVGPDLVLVPDPYGEERDDTDKVVYHHSGSYLVFRKLEQNVRAFKDGENRLAQALGLTGEDVERAGALVMGRFKDGTPVVLQPTAGRPANNFTYNEDPDGEKCPLQAHIRKVNPREEDTKSRRITRRGITYGTRVKEPKDNPNLEELPSEGVGLLFMCYQKDIEKQFEFLQLAWANNPHFPEKQEPGIDPIIGQPGGSRAVQQKWPMRWNDLREKHTPCDFHGFVTLKGGEYFFAPSIHFLREIETKG
jgi:Dyp-type peroxidase family